MEYVPPATRSAPLAGVTQAEYCRSDSSCFKAPCRDGSDGVDGAAAVAPPNERADRERGRD